VLSKFTELLALRLPGEPVRKVQPETIVDMRNLMRDELGFGKPVALDKAAAWISTLEGAKPL
jgi:hypothetical protein